MDFGQIVIAVLAWQTTFYKIKVFQAESTICFNALFVNIFLEHYKSLVGGMKHKLSNFSYFGVNS